MKTKKFYNDAYGRINTRGFEVTLFKSQESVLQALKDEGIKAGGLAV